MTPTAIECESRIHRVSVYARGALVARRITLPAALPEASTELTVKGITPLAELGSVRAILDGDREVVALRPRFITPPGPASSGTLLERVRELYLERLRLKGERTHLKARRDLFASVSLDPSMARSWRRVDPSARLSDALALSGLLSRELAAIDARLAAIEDAIEELDRSRQAAELASAQASHADREGDGRSSVDVLVRLGPGAASSVRSLEIEYVVRAARWFPAYTARFSAGATRVEWSIEALVAQVSGEDWTHVALALSTADLVTDVRLPELASLRLGRAQPPARRGYRPAPEGLSSMFEGYDRFVSALPAPARPPRRRELPRASDPAANPPSMDPLLTTPTPGLHSDTLLDLRFEDDNLLDVPQRTTLPSADAMHQELEEMKQQAFSPVNSPSMPPAPAPPQAMAFARQMTPMAANMDAPPRAKRASGSRASIQEVDSGAPAMWEPAAPAAIEPSDAWLDFDALRLRDPSDRTSRGRLVRDDAASGLAGSGAQASMQIAYTTIGKLETPANACDPRESRGQFDHRYDAEGLADIPSNGRFHRASVVAASASASPRFITVPREAAEVYREVELKNPFQSPLLAGPVDVFIDGALLAQSAIGHVDRGGVIFLGLGVEERLRVARNARVEEGSAGLLGGSTAVEHAVTIDISSSLGRDLEVTVIDRIPITDDKEIEIKTLYARPAAEAYTQVDRGQPVRRGMRWQLPIPAGGKARIEFGYRVTLSAKSEIVGGNRRE